MTSCNEQPIRIDSGGLPLTGMLYLPAAAPAAAVLLCDPWFEERKAAHRPLVELARVLADRGAAVLRFDCRGCGDSPGDFAEFALADWGADTLAAWDVLRQRAPACPGALLGLRLGAVLAAYTSQQRADVASLILWEPVTTGRDHLQQEFRKKLMKEMLTFGGTQASRDSFFKTLDAGDTVDFDGYAITPALYRQLLEVTPASLLPPPERRVLLVGVSPTGQLSPALTRLQSELDRVPCTVTAQALQEQPFWNLIGLVDCSPLIRLTVEWLLNPPALPGGSST